MRRTVESRFTAYISHTFADLHGEENGPMRDSVQGLLLVVVVVVCVGGV